MDYRDVWHCKTGKTSDEASFAGVGVDNIWLYFVQQLPDVDEGLHIFEWANGAAQAHHLTPRDGRVDFVEDQRVGLVAVNKRDLMALFGKPIGAEQRVFVGAACDKAGDDMDDPVFPTCGNTGNWCHNAELSRAPAGVLDLMTGDVPSLSDAAIAIDRYA